MPLTTMHSPLDILKGPGHRSPRRLSASFNAYQPEDEPLACELIRTGRVQSQPHSLLLSRCPREIRDLVYYYALQRYEDQRRPYSRYRRYCKPGREHAPRIAIELLLTCSAIYVETFALPVQLNPLVCHHGDYDDVPAQFPLGFRPIQSPWQFAALQSIDIHLSQRKLEDDWIARYALFLLAKERHEIKDFRVKDSPVRGIVSSVTAGSFINKYMRTAMPDEYARERDGFGERWARNEGSPWGFCHVLQDPFIVRMLTKLTLRMARTGWWTWKEPPESEKKLAMDPALGEIEEWNQPTVEEMETMAQLRRLGVQMDPYPVRSWGAQVSWFKSLRMLELVLETFATKRDQLERVSECAQTWTFPLDEGLTLAWDGAFERLTWKGVPDYGYEVEIPWLRRPYMEANPAEVDTSLYITGHPLEFEIFTMRWRLAKAVT